MYLCDLTWNVLNFSVFYHTSCGKHDVPWYGVEETNYIYVHEVTANSDLIVLIKNFLGTLVILTGSTCWFLHHTVLPFRCGILGPYISSAILKSSRRIGMFCRILLSTAWRIRFIGLPVMCWNRLARSAHFLSRAVYISFLSLTFGIC